MNTEFKREVCFSFFESYLEQGKMIQEQFGDEDCAGYFIGLAEYALYQKTPENPRTNLFITGLKNAIDAGQNKRAKAFNGEDTELTDKVLNYIKEHPKATEREIAKEVGCSNSKVHKVKQKYLSSTNDNTPNNTYNSDSTSNNNGVSMSVSNAPCVQPKRLLEDLREEELDSLLKSFQRRVRYEELSKEYNLAYGVLNKDLGNRIKEIKEARKQEARANDVKDSFVLCSEEDLEYLSECLDCKEGEVAGIAVKLGYPAEALKAFFQEQGDVFNKAYYLENHAHEYDTYFDFVSSNIHENIKHLLN